MKIISLGMGVQSTALYFKSSMDELPRADYAIFADPGREGRKTYDYLHFLLEWQAKNNGVPILVRSEMNLYEDLLNPGTHGAFFASIPAYTGSECGKEGMLRRQCTYDYKIQVVDNCIRDLYGLKPKDRRPKTEVWHGITLDEMGRMSAPTDAWKVNVYPFIGYAATKKDRGFRIDWGVTMTRGDVLRWYELAGLPIPPKSSCVFCPYRSDFHWQQMKINEPDDFQAAVEVDTAIRNSTKKGIASPVYLHRSLKPLAAVEFDETMAIEWGDCSGNCHV